MINMPKYGFIHDKLDIKLLILYVLNRLPGPVDYSTLGDLVNNLDDGIDYFDYTECVHDLIQNGHILDDDGFYSITEKGIKNSESVESSIPYTVRMHAKTELLPFVEEMRRQGMISAEREEKDGCNYVTLSLNDGAGDIMKMKLLVSDEEQAKQIKRNFRLRAEQLYKDIIEVLSEESVN